MPRTADFFTRRNYIRTLIAGYALGILIVVITNLGGEKENVPRLAAFVLIIGFCINSMIWAIQLLMRRHLERC